MMRRWEALVTCWIMRNDQYQRCLEFMLAVNGFFSKSSAVTTFLGTIAFLGSVLIWFGFWLFTGAFDCCFCWGLAGAAGAPPKPKPPNSPPPPDFCCFPPPPAKKSQIVPGPPGSQHEDRGPRRHAYLHHLIVVQATAEEKMSNCWCELFREQQ